jgi:nucleotide-binding universal stress UspA family protein
MTSPGAILCPVDFSEHSRRALRVAALLAARFESRLVVLNVVDPLLAEAARVRLGVDLAKGETQPALAEFVKSAWPDAAAMPQPRLAVRVGDPAAVIVEFATADRIDLIVIGTQGLGGIRKWLLGSTTEHVLRESRTPVLAVPPAESPLSGDRERPFGTGPVLAATDFSASSTAAVRAAATFGARLGMPIVLAHVVEPVIVPPQWSSYVQETNDSRVRDAWIRLKGIEDQLGGVERLESVITLGNPEEQIAALAEGRSAGLIAVGLAGDEQPFGRRPGSIAYSVLCSAGVPVLVVPLPQTPA